MANKQILEQVAAGDVALLMQKDATYQGSWKKRGGVGAYFTLIRPIDRFINILERHINRGLPPDDRVPIPDFDIFARLAAEDAAGMSGKDDGSVQALMRDIRCYLLLVESEMIERKQADNYRLPAHDSLGEVQDKHSR